MSTLTWRFGLIADDIIAAQAELNSLDAVAGDGDLGLTMTTAAEAVKALLPELEGMELDAALKRCGAELARKAPSTSGTLFGTALLRAGAAAGHESFSTEAPVAKVARLVAAAAEGIQQRGKAKPGDKTVLDALVPARDALVRASGEGLDLQSALQQAAEAARAGAEETRGLQPRVGRASWLADRSEGHEDGGAHLVALVFASATRSLVADPPSSA
ncbi:MAG: DAK2 domain-containing protein [Chloroflexota bacterium]|nr:DAK2 domain-containing protein [Chloroflexota bacterium]